MRCLICAAEMYVTQVVQDDTMPVPGFEHHTLECLECGNIERRLVFTREKTQPVSPSYRRKKERIVKPRTPMEAFERVRRRDAALAAQRAADRSSVGCSLGRKGCVSPSHPFERFHRCPWFDNALLLTPVAWRNGLGLLTGEHQSALYVTALQTFQGVVLEAGDRHGVVLHHLRHIHFRRAY